MKSLQRLLPAQKTFPQAEEYVALQSSLEPEGWIDWVLLFNDMIIQPVYIYISWALGYDPSKLTMFMIAYRSIEIWWKWGRYQVLRDIARHWVLLTKLAGGPFISCNDPKYHIFVYAEAIERLRLLSLR